MGISGVKVGVLWYGWESCEGSRGFSCYYSNEWNSDLFYDTPSICFLCMSIPALSTGIRVIKVLP